jgi:hypothetical protein
MNRQYSFQKAPRCSATSKRTRERCKAPAVRGWAVCRFRGARGGGPKGKRNGMYRHGLYTNEVVKERRFLRELVRSARDARSSFTRRRVINAQLAITRIQSKPSRTSRCPPRNGASVTSPRIENCAALARAGERHPDVLCEGALKKLRGHLFGD